MVCKQAIQGRTGELFERGCEKEKVKKEKIKGESGGGGLYFIRRCMQSKSNVPKLRHSTAKKVFKPG